VNKKKEKGSCRYSLRTPGRGLQKKGRGDRAWIERACERWGRKEGNLSSQRSLSITSLQTQRRQ